MKVSDLIEKYKLFHNIIIESKYMSYFDQIETFIPYFSPKTIKSLLSIIYEYCQESKNGKLTPISKPKISNIGNVLKYTQKNFQVYITNIRPLKSKAKIVHLGSIQLYMVWVLLTHRCLCHVIPSFRLSLKLNWQLQK